MAEEGQSSSSRNLPRSVEEVFADYDGRRRGILKALQHQAEDFFQQCRPDNGSLLGLYAFPDQSWKLLRLEELEAENDDHKLPRPTVGINIQRDNMSKLDWLNLVAVNSDSWLLSVAAYFAACNGFHENDSTQLFQKINGVSTVADAFKGANGPKLSSTEDRQQPTTPKAEPSPPKGIEIPEQAAKQDRESGDTEATCPVCEDKHKEAEVWISCDLCERWYHGDCVNISLTKIQQDLEEFICPSCGTKRRRTG